MRQTCWYAGCGDVGAAVALSGGMRVLCRTHAEGVRLAASRPGQYRIFWGEPKAERVATLEQELAAATERARVLDEAAAEPEWTDWASLSEDEPLPEVDERLEAWDAVREAHERLEAARSGPDHPFVKVAPIRGPRSAR